MSAHYQFHCPTLTILQHPSSRESGQESRSASKVRSSPIGTDETNGRGQSRRSNQGRICPIREAGAETGQRVEKQVWQVWSQVYRDSLIPELWELELDVLAGEEE